MIGETRFNLQPIESHDVVGDSQVVVIEIVKLFVVQVERVAKFSLNLTTDISVADAVAVTIGDL